MPIESSQQLKTCSQFPASTPKSSLLLCISGILSSSKFNNANEKSIFFLTQNQIRKITNPKRHKTENLQQKFSVKLIKPQICPPILQGQLT
jgi:hypothetical protein